MGFKKHDQVKWISQARGRTKEKVGVVAQVVAPGHRPDRERFPTLYTTSGIGLGRKSESYVVMVGNRPYWPRESLLRPVADPLEQVYCPGCGEHLEADNCGCPHCGYEANWYGHDGRILSVREFAALPTHPADGAVWYLDVSPKFIAAVVAAARA